MQELRKGVSDALPEHGMTVVLRVIKADITSNVNAFGRMDPYAIVRWTNADGRTFEAARTRTDWNAHQTPMWNHACMAEPYQPLDVLQFKVYEDDALYDQVIGEVTTSLGDLLGDAAVKAETGQAASGPICKLEMETNGTKTGTISVQVIVLPEHVHRQSSYDSQKANQGSKFKGLQEEDLTRVSSDLFESPAARLQVSGGTAPFFSLKLRSPKPGQSADHYIAKDLSRATDEVGFYEEMLAIKAGNYGSGLTMLLSFCFEYLGIATVPVAGAGKTEKPKDLLVLRNLRSGCAKLRLLDVKIGQKTAQAGWQGKSRLAALRQSLVDGLTNSAGEGYRLEGFDGMPAVLQSMDPLLDFGGSSDGSKVAKKAKRIMLQRMPGAEMFMHFLDVHVDLEDPGDAALDEMLTPTELSELVLHQIVARLVRLALVCRHAPVPQKWIGSSVALGFDVGALPPRKSAEDLVRRQVIVNIFDWGRSELNTFSHHQSLSGTDKDDRGKFWAYYVGGIDRLAWEAARAYRHRFSNAQPWEQVMLTVTDWDSATPNDFIGRVWVSPLQQCDETTVVLHDLNGAEVKNFSGRKSTLTYSISYRAMPAGSRLQGCWRVKLISAANLPGRDKGKLQVTSDAFVELWATSKDKHLCTRQQSTIKVGDCDPVWEEVLELPLAHDNAEALDDAFALAGSSVLGGNDGGPHSDLFTPEMQLVSGQFSDRSGSARAVTMDSWEKLLDDAAERLKETLEEPKSEKSSSQKLARSTSQMLRMMRDEEGNDGVAREDEPVPAEGDVEKTACIDVAIVDIKDLSRNSRTNEPTDANRKEHNEAIVELQPETEGGNKDECRCNCRCQ